ncbi:MAG TPA: thiol:disulfide interchange protein DsbA/DsbL [Xanthomonadaceae bacterium]|nr:thiol:disulfide interchange protein DsbA/DsbL [Xanthomonadaceae bacterium]
MKRFALLLSLLLPLAACQQDAAAPAAADTSAPAAAEPAATTPSADAEAAAALSRQGALPEDTAAAAGDAGTPAADAAAAPVSDAAAGDGLVVGTDYVVIQNGQPYQPVAGKIEVAEAFNFICPACAAFEPLFAAWQEKQPADVKVSYVPADFGGQWRPYAQAYLVAEAKGLDEKSHAAVFHAIHVSHELPGEGEKSDVAKVGAFYAKYGADPKQFVDAMQSFATDAKLTRARQFMIASGVDSTPTLIVNGKYRVTTKKSFQDMLRVADLLIARERAAGAH